MGERADYEAQRAREIAAFRQLPSLADIERERITTAQRLCHGCRKDMMELLGMPKTTLYRKLAEYQEADDANRADRSRDPESSDGVSSREQDLRIQAEHCGP